MIPMNENWLRVSTLLQRLVVLGCKYAIISPGSRNTPLSHCAIHTPGLQTYVEMDERNAAYVALGMGKSSHTPAILICTSGTAVANYFPAIIEAYHSRIPMIILTADRPPHLQDCGAPQTIRQQAIYGSYVINEWTLPSALSEKDCKAIITLANSVYSNSVGNDSGPVHINCPFDEPLQPIAVKPETIEAVWKNISHLLHEPVSISDLSDSTPDISDILLTIEKSKQPVIIAGPDAARNDSEQKAILRLAKQINAPIIADIASGMRDTAMSLRYPVVALRNASEDLKSDCLIWLGTYPTSIPITKWMKEQHSPCIQIQPHSHQFDPDGIVTDTITGAIDNIVNQVVASIPKRDYTEDLHNWMNADNIARLTLENSVLPLEAIAPAIAISAYPNDADIFLSNSMPIRYADWFSPGNKSVRIFANKGVNGIDGVIPTSAGIALPTGHPVVLCIGDVAFYHSINALEFISQHQLPVTILLMNNRGGGVFHYLPAKDIMDKWDKIENGSTSSFERIQGTSHTIKFDAICNGFGILHGIVTTPEQLKESIRENTSAGKPIVLEIPSQREETAKAVQEFFKQCKQKIK